MALWFPKFTVSQSGSPKYKQAEKCGAGHLNPPVSSVGFLPGLLWMEVLRLGLGLPACLGKGHIPAPVIVALQGDFSSGSCRYYLEQLPSH